MATAKSLLRCDKELFHDFGALGKIIEKLNTIYIVTCMKRCLIDG